MLRSAVYFELKNGIPAIAMDIAVIQGTISDFTFIPTKLDPLLIELMATAKFVVDSPDILNLERLIIQELADLKASRREL